MVTLLPMLPSRDQRGTNSLRRTICSTNNRNVEQDTLCGDPKRYLSGLSINKKLVGFPNRTVAMRVPAGERGEGAVPARQGNTGGRGERAAGGRSRHGESRRSLPFLPRARAVGIIGFARYFFPIFVF